MTPRRLVLPLALAACAAATPSAAQPIGAPIPWTLRDSLSKRGDFVYAVAIPSECPAAELWEHLEWQWRRQPREVLADVWRLADGGEEKALEGMRDREGRQRDAAIMYQRCHAASPAAFWYLVVTASSAGRRTLEDCREHIDWQRKTSRGSVRSAARWADGRERGRARPELVPVVAMAALLSGQSHNDRAMAGYRACYRDDGTALWSYVASKGR
jgi:hypothetical protein